MGAGNWFIGSNPSNAYTYSIYDELDTPNNDDFEVNELFFVVFIQNIETVLPPSFDEVNKGEVTFENSHCVVGVKDQDGKFVVSIAPNKNSEHPRLINSSYIESVAFKIRNMLLKVYIDVYARCGPWTSGKVEKDSIMCKKEDKTVNHPSLGKTMKCPTTKTYEVVDDVCRDAFRDYIMSDIKAVNLFDMLYRQQRWLSVLNWMKSKKG